MGSERRRHPRLGVNVPVTFQGDTVNGEGSALNISLEGCLIESDTQVEQGTYLEMSIHIPERLLPLVVELAAVRWISGRVFGVEFRYMQPDQHECLEQFIATHQNQAAS